MSFIMYFSEFDIIYIC